MNPLSDFWRELFYKTGWSCETKSGEFASGGECHQTTSGKSW